MRDTGSVPEFCSCGAQLVEDARFCHKCGKPTQDTVEHTEEPVAAPPAPVPVQPARPEIDLTSIGFHNPLAVRTGFLIAAIYMIVFMVLQFAPALAVLGVFVLLPVSGFAAAYLYARRSGQTLSVRGGARMGWITGIFGFTISMVIHTMDIIAVSYTGGLAEALRENLAKSSRDPEVQRQFAQVIDNPGGLLLFLFLLFFIFFLLFTILPTIGGALSAKVMEKD